MNGSSEDGFFPSTGEGHFLERCPQNRFGLELSLQTTDPKECALVACALCDTNVIQMANVIQWPHNPLLSTFDNPLREVEVLMA